VNHVSKRSTVLIVDDAPENLHVLMEALKADHAVLAATDGERALRLVHQEGHRPDLVLLDVVMPGLDGYEICRRLKADPGTRDIPVVFVTVLGEDQNEEYGLSLGAIDYISKPFNPDLVRARVKNHLELKRHRDHLETLAHERARELALTQEATIELLASLAETRDPETGGHIRRTQNYVRALALRLRRHPARAMGLDAETVELLFKSAPLHDIGKVGVPDRILLKPGLLTAEEFEVMKRHAVHGHDAILSAERRLGENSFLRLAREIAYTHHEKWDGTGYPRGLAGLDIPLSGRLMALADVYDALISRRVYKPPFPHAQAVEIIRQGRGAHFDPVLVDAFLDIRDEFLEIARLHADGEMEEDREGA
jgi:putative two-component system response regulator